MLCGYALAGSVDSRSAYQKPATNAASISFSRAYRQAQFRDYYGNGIASQPRAVSHSWRLGEKAERKSSGGAANGRGREDDELR